MSHPSTPRVNGAGGTVWTEADYTARGYGRMSVRLATETLAQLERLARIYGKSRTEILDEIIRAEYKRRI